MCGCFCSKEKCDCGNPEGSIYKNKKGDWELANVGASGGIGWGGHSISGDVEVNAFKRTWQNAQMKVGGLSAGAYAIDGGFGGGVRASATAFNVKTDGVEVKVGVSLDTGGRFTDNGVEFKVAGFGVSIGKKIEVSTIFGGIAW